MESWNDSSRGGELVGFHGPDDVRSPYNWSSTRKWSTASLALLGTLLLPLNGTSVTLAAAELSKEFSVRDTAHFTHTYWSVSSWALGGALFVLLFLPLLEEIGVRRTCLAFYAFFLLMLIPQACARNYETLLIARFFAGGCVSVLANTIASMIPDLWEGDDARSLPVSLYILFYLAGSTLGPVAFAPVTQFLPDWRWIFYIQLILYAIIFIPFAVFIPETRAQVILANEAKRLRRLTGRDFHPPHGAEGASRFQKLLRSIIRPIYLLFTEPVLIACTLWSAFAFGTVFSFTQSVEQVFAQTYGWQSYSCGYVQGAVVIGEVVGWAANLFGIRLYLQSAERNKESPGRPLPEARLYLSIFASFLGMTGGMFVYGWTSYPHISWAAPAVGLAMVGCGIQIIVSSIGDYVVDAYAASGCAGSAIGAVAAGENIVAATLPLSAAAMYTNVGFQWASSLWGFLALLLSFIPVVFVWKGRLLRARSPFMQSGKEQVSDDQEA